MKNDGLLTGILIGGMFGVAVALLAINTAKGEAVNAVEDKEGKEDGKQLNSKDQDQDQDQETDKQETDNKSEKAKTKDVTAGIKKFVTNTAKTMMTDNQDNSESNGDKASDAETSKEKDKQGTSSASAEVVDKKDDTEEEVRNPADEVKKKAGKEGVAMGEDIASKLNFGKKIAQLEEALKKLREENTQEN